MAYVEGTVQLAYTRLGSFHNTVVELDRSECCIHSTTVVHLLITREGCLHTSKEGRLAHALDVRDL